MPYILAAVARGACPRTDGRATGPGAGPDNNDKKRQDDMLRILKVLFLLAVLGFAGLAGYAYLGDMTPVRSEIRTPVQLDVQR